jgi:DNA-binding response OmpR family regulator
MFSSPTKDLHRWSSQAVDDARVITGSQRTDFRGPGASARPETLHIEHLEIRPSEYQVLVAGRRARLTVREFQIFYELAQRRDRVVRRQELYDLVWGGPMTYRDRSVDVFVRKLRRKLFEVSPEWVYIHTHFGIGYRLSVEPAPVIAGPTD